MPVPPKDDQNPVDRNGNPRKVCAYPGCNRFSRYKGMAPNGGNTAKYGRYCREHHKFTGISGDSNTGKKSLIDNNIPCEICGWDKCYNDRHRTSHEIRYHRTEVVIVCPNCHRLIDAGKMRVRRLPTGKILVFGPAVKEISPDGRVILKGISEYTGAEDPLPPEPKPDFGEDQPDPEPDTRSV